MIGNLVNIVMYHYVFDENDPRFNKLKGLTISNFRSQIESLSKKYKFLSVLDFQKCYEENTEFPSDSCILTFDDGTIDHYKYVYPILKDYGIPGYFSLVTSTIEDRKPLYVHLIHNLLENLDIDELRCEINKVIIKKYPSKSPLKSYYPNDTYRYDNKKRSSLKYQLNYLWDPRITNEVILDVFNSNFEKINDFADSFYMKWDQINEMEKNGMTFGNHSHKHISCSLLSENELKNDVSKSKQIINDKLISSKASSLYTYPYGTIDSYSDKTIEVLKSFGYKLAFTARRGLNGQQIDPFQLKRFSTNDIINI
jgi:peptidoglycan/xylan/chitin deacetylase (PgdA/CDA1 family)